MERRDIIQTKDLEYFQELDQELKLVPLTYDFTFKKVFKNNPIYMKEFIYTMLPFLNLENYKVRFLDSELTKEKKERKKTVDILISLDDKIYIDIEMNRSKFQNIYLRNLEYLKKLSTMLWKEGEDIQNLKEKKVIQINLNANEKEKAPDDIIASCGLLTGYIYDVNGLVFSKNLEENHYLYYNEGVRRKDVIWLTALTSKTFTELYKLISQVLEKSVALKFMEDVVDMSYHVRKKKGDLFCTYDLFRIVTEKFKMFCEENKYPGLIFTPITASPGYYYFRPTGIYKLDYVRRKTKFITKRECCGSYDEVIGVSPGYKDSGFFMQSDDFILSYNIAALTFSLNFTSFLFLSTIFDSVFIISSLDTISL